MIVLSNSMKYPACQPSMALRVVTIKPNLQLRLPRTAVPISKRQFTQPIRGIHHALLGLGGDLAGRDGIAGRHVHDGVVAEEVAWAQEQRDGLDGHDGEVLGRGNVRHAERVPQHDVRIGDGLAAVADPLRESAGGLTRGLRDVAAGGPELVVLVCGDLLAEA